MALCPFATQKLIEPGPSDPKIEPRMAILHVDAGGAESLFEYFRDRSGGVESHFHVKWSGEIEQYRDTDWQADANLAANDFAVSIETQGFGQGKWNKRQLRSIKRLLLWLNSVHPAIKLVRCDGPFGSGVGYHTMWGAPSDWTPVAKSCPGPNRVIQFQDELVPWMLLVTNPPAPKPRRKLVVVTANLFKNNQHAAEDLELLAATKAHIIGINEGKNFHDLIVDLDGYTAFYGNTGTGRPEQANPILVRDDIQVHGEGYLEISEPVGRSPGRAAVYVKYTMYGQKRAHINLHANSHVQAGTATPHRLPRVVEYIKGMQATAGLIRGLEAEGYEVTITGDLNWSWTPGARQWKWAPKVVFGALGYKAQFEHHTAPARPAGDPRPIEYVLYRDDDLVVWSQNFVEGEHSDHPFHVVTFHINGD